MGGALGIPYNFTEIDGVPVFWADVPGPVTAALLFRAGRADESLAGAGVTKLVEQLALQALGPRHQQAVGRVSGTITSFQATGSADEIVAFLWQLSNVLRGLPTDRLDVEKRVLATDEENTTRGIAERALALRYGASSHGLAGFEQYGLRWLGADEVRRWAGERFTRHNAALWITTRPPDSLRLPLNDGVRVPAPAVAPRPGLETPAFVAHGGGVIAVTLEGEASVALDMATGAVADRVYDQLVTDRALSRDVQAWSVPLSDTRVHKLLAMEVEDYDATDVLRSVLDLFDDVGSGGPSDEEIERGREAALLALTAEEAVPGGLDQMAVNELLGARRIWKEELAEMVRATGAGPAAGALRSALRTQLAISPAGVPKPSDRQLADYPWHSPDVVRGIEVRPFGARPRFGAPRPSEKLIVGDEGASRVGIEPGIQTTVRLSELVAAIQEPDGGLTLVGRDGLAVGLDIAQFPEARPAISDLESRLPRELLVPPLGVLAGGGHDIDALARRKLAGALPERELRLLRGWLGEGEEPVTMVLATTGPKVGLLTLTNQRILWICHGVTGEPEQKELPYRDVRGASLAGRNGRTIAVRSPVGETAFSDLHPRERGPELVTEIQRRSAEAAASGGPRPAL